MKTGWQNLTQGSDWKRKTQGMKWEPGRRLTDAVQPFYAVYFNPFGVYWMPKHNLLTHSNLTLQLNLNPTLLSLFTKLKLNVTVQRFYFYFYPQQLNSKAHNNCLKPLCTSPQSLSSLNWFLCLSGKNAIFMLDRDTQESVLWVRVFFNIISFAQCI